MIGIRSSFEKSLSYARSYETILEDLKAVRLTLKGRGFSLCRVIFQFKTIEIHYTVEQQ